MYSLWKQGVTLIACFQEEEVIALATADLEDFVLQFLDRCFTLIESSSLEMTRLEREEDKRSELENMAEGALFSTCTTVLMQTSSQIFKVWHTVSHLMSVSTIDCNSEPVLSNLYYRNTFIHDVHWVFVLFHLRLPNLHFQRAASSKICIYIVIPKKLHAERIISFMF